MDDIDTSKILSKWGMKTSSPKKLDEFVTVISKRLTMNIIKNIINVKEVVDKKPDNTITFKDVKEATEIMKRLRFYSELHINMKGGSRTVLPPSYFSASAPEPMYNDGIGSDQNVTNFDAVQNYGLVRPEISSTQFIGDGSIEFPGPVGMQQGGGMMDRVKAMFSKLKNTKFVEKQTIEEIVDELNKKYKKNPIVLESEKVLQIIRDSVNKNINILFAYYSSNVSSTELNVDKMKSIVEKEAMFRHMSRVPSQ